MAADAPMRSREEIEASWREKERLSRLAPEVRQGFRELNLELRFVDGAGRERRGTREHVYAVKVPVASGFRSSATLHVVFQGGGGHVGRFHLPLEGRNRAEATLTFPCPSKTYARPKPDAAGRREPPSVRTVDFGDGRTAVVTVGGGVKVMKHSDGRVVTMTDRDVRAPLTRTVLDHYDVSVAYHVPRDIQININGHGVQSTSDGTEPFVVDLVVPKDVWA